MTARDIDRYVTVPTVLGCPFIRDFALTLDALGLVLTDAHTCWYPNWSVNYDVAPEHKKDIENSTFLIQAINSNIPQWHCT